MVRLTKRSAHPIDFPVRITVLVLGVLVLSAFVGEGGEFVLTAGLAVSLVLGGIGYGATKQKADTAHERLDALHKTLEDMLADAASHRTRIEHDIVGIRIAMATIAAGEKRRESEENREH